MVGIWVFFFIKINPSFITTFSFNYSNQSHSVLYWQWNCSPDHGDISLAKMLSKVGSAEDTSARTKHRKAKGRKLIPAASNAWTEASKYCAMNSGDTSLEKQVARFWAMDHCQSFLGHFKMPFVRISWKTPQNGGFPLINDSRSLNLRSVEWTWLTHHSQFIYPIHWRMLHNTDLNSVYIK